VSSLLSFSSLTPHTINVLHAAAKLPPLGGASFVGVVWRFHEFSGIFFNDFHHI
jgi:hypothetical protein